MNNVIYNEEFYVTENCKVHGSIFKLENTHQKMVWLNHVIQRDKVYLTGCEDTLVGVCKDHSKVLAYIHTELGDLAFCSDEVMQSGRFKSSLLAEGLVPYDDDWNICVGINAELVSNNQFDLYEDRYLYIDAVTAADLIGVELEDTSSLYKWLIEEALYYLPDDVQEWISDLGRPSRQDHFYLYEAFGLNMDNDDEVLHATEWYDPQVVSNRLIKAYTGMLHSRLEDESYTLLCKERVARVREERRAARRAPEISE